MYQFSRTVSSLRGFTLFYEEPFFILKRERLAAAAYLHQKLGGVQAEMSSQGSRPVFLKVCGWELRK